jgi:parvulin-like peptidyl-prolyl isomerase
MNQAIKIKFSIVAILFQAVLLTLLGCQKTQEKEAILAQVGTATLTLAELRESFPAEFEQIIHREQYLDFIKRWIDDEVIYQQAQKANLAKDSLMARKLAKITRKLMIEEFLSRDGDPEISEPDEMAMSQYYEMHKEEFRRKVPEVKFVHIRVETLKQAADLRGKIMRGDFLAIAASNSMDPNPESYNAVGFKKQSEFPSCLSQDISKTSINAVSQPITCPDGIYLLKVLDRQEAGSLIPFAETKEEISSILAMARKDKLLESRIAKYKDGLSISYNLDQIPGQSDIPRVDSMKAEIRKSTLPDSELKSNTAATVNPTPLKDPIAKEPKRARQSTAQNKTPATVRPQAVRPAQVNVDSLVDSKSPGITKPTETTLPNSTTAKPESEEKNNDQSPPPNP